MSGIAGWMSYSGSLQADRNIIETMTKTLRARGPDREGNWLDNYVALGHQEMVIDDLSDPQPAFLNSRHGTLAVVYDGEIFNRFELKTTLEARGRTCQSSLPSELIINSYLEWGLDFPNHIHGAFALALWDGINHQLLLVRDRLGICPLYYSPLDNAVLFGSEPKAILAHPSSQNVVDANGLRGLFALNGLLAPAGDDSGWALWKNIYEVEPGTEITVGSSGVYKHTYWQLAAKPHTDSYHDTIKQVYNKLVRIIDQQLMTHAIPSVTLSGGLDSSAIATIASQRLAKFEKQLSTFSIEYPINGDQVTTPIPPTTRDSHYVWKIVNHIGSEHHQVDIVPQQAADRTVRRAMIAALDAPMARGTFGASMYLFFKSIHSTTNVVLSGAGADIVFFGSPDLPQHVAKFANPEYYSRLISRQYTRLLTKELDKSLTLDEYIKDRYATELRTVSCLEGETETDRLLRTVCNFSTTKQGRLLRNHKDRISMAAGLQMRVPYVDHDLIEYVYNVPYSFRVANGSSKDLLRNAVRDILPQAVIERPKVPLPTLAQSTLYRTELLTQLKELNADRNHPVFNLLDHRQIKRVAKWAEKSGESSNKSLNGVLNLGEIEQILELSEWLDMYKPRFELA